LVEILFRKFIIFKQNFISFATDVYEKSGCSKWKDSTFSAKTQKSVKTDFRVFCTFSSLKFVYYPHFKE